jgi:DnaK suppressor protein
MAGANQTDQDEARRRLAEDEMVTRDRIRSLTKEFTGIVDASTDANSDDEHDPEGATIAFERAKTASLLTEAEDHLTELHRARARLDAGTYGTCVRCHHPIDPERLSALPATETCIRCAATVSSSPP